MVIITWAALWISSHPAEIAIFSNFPQPSQDQVQQKLPTDSQKSQVLHVMLSQTTPVFLVMSQWSLVAENWRNNWICLVQSSFADMHYFTGLVARNRNLSFQQSHIGLTLSSLAGKGHGSMYCRLSMLLYGVIHAEMCYSTELWVTLLSITCIVSISAPVVFLTEVRTPHIPSWQSKRRCWVDRRTGRGWWEMLFFWGFFFLRVYLCVCLCVCALDSLSLFGLFESKSSERKTRQLLLSPKSNFSNITAPVGTHRCVCVCVHVLECASLCILCQ